MDFITTSEASNICGVARTTMSKWVDEGRIQAFVTPGGHRKINKSNLLEFINRQNIISPKRLNEKKRILIVDDNPDDVRLLEAAFLVALDKYEIHTASGGFQGIYKIGAIKPNIVILDLVMPDMDGFKVCSSIKNSPETIEVKVIAVTAFNDPQKQQMAYRCGADAYYSKPLDLKGLMETVVKFSELHPQITQITQMV
ncbi:MAG: response regulator [Pseudomonadota bacterium]